SMTTESNPTLPALDEMAIAELEMSLPGGDLSDALATFADELEKRGKSLVTNLSSADESELASLAHGLKGSAATFCAPALAQAAKELENKLAGQDGADIDAATQRVSIEIRRVVDKLRKMLAGRNRARQ
ncbi:MAG: Hpt domain-containing protein, partial [Gammaproteobacteria bacterium]|nr:Hpt domain-containing protein [Gammaproteobacteria bacterium]